MFTKSQNWESKLYKKFLTILCVPAFFGLIFSAPVLTHASEPANTNHHLNDDAPIVLDGKALDGEVQLNWVDPNSSEDLAGYQIIYSTHPNISFDPPKYLAMIRTDIVQTFEVGGLENGNEYYFAIARLDLKGDLSGQSNVLKLAPLDINAPITSLTTNPTLPSGQNHWFISKPEIILAANEKATTYYQWNGLESAGWQIYSQPLVASEGENILYYYSVDRAGNIEQPKWQIVKVDTIIPLAPVLAGIWDESSASVELSWNLDPDIAKVEVWQTSPVETLIASLPAGQVKFLLDAVTRNQNYGYKLLAYDAAGNVISSNEILVQVPAKPIAVPAVVKTTTLKVAKKNKPQIGEGVSTVSQVQSNVEPTPAVEGIQDQNSQNTNPTTQSGWNRLLIALSILIIAAGVAVGGYYGYEWMNAKSGKSSDDHKNSRW